MLTIALAGAGVRSDAAGGALPWDTPLTTLQTDLQGPVAHAITTAAIIGTGITVVGQRAWHRRAQRCRRSRSAAPARSGRRTLMTTLFPLGGALF